MYGAKGAGGGRERLGDGTVDPIARLEPAAGMPRGIECGELELHHQPILRLADCAMIGVESAVCRRDPTRGGALAPPVEFIAVAERTGVITRSGTGCCARVDNGCRIAQGYHFSRPVPAREMAALLDASIAPERRR